MAVKEEPEPVTLAFGVPEPHCAAAVERSANAVTKMDSLAMIVTGGFRRGKITTRKSSGTSLETRVYS